MNARAALTDALNALAVALVSDRVVPWVRARVLDALAALPELRERLPFLTIERALCADRAPRLRDVEMALYAVGLIALEETPAPASTPCVPPPSSGGEWADEIAAASAQTAALPGVDAHEGVDPASVTERCAPPDLSLPEESAPGEAAGVVDIDVDFGECEPSRPFELVRRGSALDSLLHG